MPGDYDAADPDLLPKIASRHGAPNVRQKSN
jgi:hypothetical protein